MKDTKLGFYIQKDIERVSENTIKSFDGVTSANVSDALGSRGAMHYSIKPIVSTNKPVIGSAVTVRTRSGDNLMICKAIKLCKPGDVLVVSAPGGTHNSLWGGVLSTMAKYYGIRAFVTDGMVRDLAETEKVGLPIWAAGILPTAPTSEGPGNINIPVSVGGVVVNPGDLIIGDTDGVVAVPKEHADMISEKAQEVAVRDDNWLEEAKKTGHFSGLDNLDNILTNKGCKSFEN